MTDGFYGDETLLTSHETPYFSLLVMLVKLMIFNAWYETLHKTSIKTDLSHQERGVPRMSFQGQERKYFRSRSVKIHHKCRSMFLVSFFLDPLFRKLP